MTANEESVRRLTDELTGYTAAAEDLAREVHESQLITKAIRRTQIIQTWLLGLKMLTMLLIGIIIWQTSGTAHQTNQIAHRQERLAQEVDDCLQPTGACKQRNDQATTIVLAIVRDSIRDDRLQDAITSLQAQGNTAGAQADEKIETNVAAQLTNEENQLRQLQGEQPTQ